MNTIINPDLKPEEQVISTRLREMKMSGMAEAFERQILDPNADLSSFMERISELVNTEWQMRYDKKLNRLLRQAKLRYPQADLDESIYEADRKLDHTSIEKLAACKWIDEGRNLIITGMTSSGKTYLSNALCVSALRKLKTVRYIKASHLMLELEQARIRDTYMDQLTSLSKVDLLAIDDFGLMELDIDKCRDLFEVIDGRDGRRSTIIISQFPVKAWFDMFKDGTYADACLSRITDRRHSYRIEMNGRSMREPV
ncbi:MAG: ATP-binding protein [Lachnospiraceae bacterium]|nr:ATP-binding protein [Lachnospiraceae bacterium]